MSFELPNLPRVKGHTLRVNTRYATVSGGSTNDSTGGMHEMKLNMSPWKLDETIVKRLLESRDEDAVRVAVHRPLPFPGVSAATGRSLSSGLTVSPPTAQTRLHQPDTFSSSVNVHEPTSLIAAHTERSNSWHPSTQPLATAVPDTAGCPLAVSKRGAKKDCAVESLDSTGTDSHCTRKGYVGFKTTPLPVLSTVSTAKDLPFTAPQGNRARGVNVSLLLLGKKEPNAKELTPPRNGRHGMSNRRLAPETVKGTPLRKGLVSDDHFYAVHPVNPLLRPSPSTEDVDALVATMIASFGAEGSFPEKFVRPVSPDRELLSPKPPSLGKDNPTVEQEVPPVVKALTPDRRSPTSDTAAHGGEGALIDDPTPVEKLPHITSKSTQTEGGTDGTNEAETTAPSPAAAIVGEMRASVTTEDIKVLTDKDISAMVASIIASYRLGVLSAPPPTTQLPLAIAQTAPLEMVRRPENSASPRSPLSARHKITSDDAKHDAEHQPPSTAAKGLNDTLPRENTAADASPCRPEEGHMVPLDSDAPLDSSLAQVEPLERLVPTGMLSSFGPCPRNSALSSRRGSVVSCRSSPCRTRTGGESRRGSALSARSVSAAVGGQCLRKPSKPPPVAVGTLSSLVGVSMQSSSPRRGGTPSSGTRVPLTRTTPTGPEGVIQKEDISERRTPSPQRRRGPSRAKTAIQETMENLVPLDDHCTTRQGFVSSTPHTAAVSDALAEERLPKGARVEQDFQAAAEASPISAPTPGNTAVTGHLPKLRRCLHRAVPIASEKMESIGEVRCVPRRPLVSWGEPAADTSSQREGGSKWRRDMPVSQDDLGLPPPQSEIPRNCHGTVRSILRTSERIDRIAKGLSTQNLPGLSRVSNSTPHTLPSSLDAELDEEPHAMPPPSFDLVRGTD